MENPVKVDPINSLNDFVIKFANVNGTGSASANQMFAKSIFRMGIPISPKNIFPSNIQGLPTWFEVRVNNKGYLGSRGGVDIAVAMNPQTYSQDVEEISEGGYLLYDSTWKRNYETLKRELTTTIPISKVRALAKKYKVDDKVVKEFLAEQKAGKAKLLKEIANYNRVNDNL